MSELIGMAMAIVYFITWICFLVGVNAVCKSAAELRRVRELLEKRGEA